MSQNGQSKNGSHLHGTVPDPTSKAAEAASSGIRTAGKMANVSLLLIQDVLCGSIDNKQGHLACRAMRNGITTIEFAQKVGYDRVVVDETPPDPLAKELEETEARAASIRAAMASRP